MSFLVLEEGGVNCLISLVLSNHFYIKETLVERRQLGVANPGDITNLKVLVTPYHEQVLL